MKIRLLLNNGLEKTIDLDGNIKKPFDIDNYLPLDSDISAWYLESS